jgi:uncharacterized protein
LCELALWGDRRGRADVQQVGADRQPVAKRLLFLGSIKWLENAAHDLAAALTDEPVPLVAVSRSGVSCAGLQAAYGPTELLRAWRGSGAAEMLRE